MLEVAPVRDSLLLSNILLGVYLVYFKVLTLPATILFSFCLFRTDVKWALILCGAQRQALDRRGLVLIPS